MTQHYAKTNRGFLSSSLRDTRRRFETLRSHSEKLTIEMKSPENLKAASLNNTLLLTVSFYVTWVCSQRRTPASKDDALKAFLEIRFARSTPKGDFHESIFLKLLLQVTENRRQLLAFWQNFPPSPSPSFRRLREEVGISVGCRMGITVVESAELWTSFSKNITFLFSFSLHSPRNDSTSQFDCLKFQERLKCEKAWKVFLVNFFFPFIEARLVCLPKRESAIAQLQSFCCCYLRELFL